MDIVLIDLDLLFFISPEFVFLRYLLGIVESSDGVLCMDPKYWSRAAVFSLWIYMIY